MSFITYHDYKSCEDALTKLGDEFQELKAVHTDYTHKVSELKKLQNKCLDGIKHQRYRQKQILTSLKAISKNANEKDKAEADALTQTLLKREALFTDLEDTLPNKNGLYLNIVLGQVNVSLLSKADKFAYKQDYERFKLIVTLIVLIFSVGLCLFLNHRVFDAVFQFLLVWYYCTLTIRESILVVNGSRIKGWWVLHHFISVLCSGIVLTWPRDASYYSFRDQFNLFSAYLSIVQVVQCYYQRSCLYKLRALGERHSMDITVDGFMSWMWRRLGFVLPFLFIGYLFQLYNSYVLYQLYHMPNFDNWQVLALSGIFLILFLGNASTTLGVVRQKMRSEGYSLRQHLKRKYRFHTTPASLQPTAGNNDDPNNSSSGSISNSNVANTAASNDSGDCDVGTAHHGYGADDHSEERRKEK